jgi:hypothetical protein
MSASRLNRSAQAIAPGTGLARAVRTWLVLGAVLSLAFPALRGSSPTLGWLPLWLVVTPLVGTLVATRHPWREARALGRVVVGDRWATTPAQARRVHR